MHGPLQTESLLAGWQPDRIGRTIHLYDSVMSTNDLAWSCAESKDADGTILFAEHQTSGRGRFSRQWESPRGASILCSMVLVDETGELDGGLLGLSLAVAACDAIRKVTGISADIRWPNDLVIQGRKLAGILVEARPRAGGGRTFVAGIGINCLQHRVHFPDTLRTEATSLEIESTEPVDRAALARMLLMECDRWLGIAMHNASERIRQAWLDRATGLGQSISVRQDGRDFSGVMIDVEPTSALVIQLNRGGRMLFDAANTTVLR